MYRRTSKYQKMLSKPYTSGMKTESHLEQNVDHQPVWAISKLRRVIDITDFDSGNPIVYKLELYKTDRIVCFDECVDGAIWKKRIGWSQILASIRKAMPRRVKE
ncbi:MAG: hypothetical protein ACJA0I_001083 [Gammaproteobacteria bacterium]|jgi:hypothetical protein